MLPEEYGGLTKKLFGRPDERLFGTLVVIDSCSVGAAYSIRRLSDYQLPSGPDFEANLAQIVEAVRFYARHVDAPIFVLPLDIGFDPLVDTPGPLQSVQQERWTTVLNTVSQLRQDVPSLVLLRTVRPDLELGRFLETGEVVHSACASVLAQGVAQALISTSSGRNYPMDLKKLLIADLDQTLWHGLLGEVGWLGLEFGESTQGRKHWIYQRFLNLLSSEGVVLAVSSKNDQSAVDEALSRLALHLDADRFVIVESNWGPKSQSVSKICRTLNLLPQSTVMVDDNPAELEEVRTAVDGVETLCFPATDSEVPGFLDRLRAHFRRASPDTSAAQRLSSYKSVVELTGLSEDDSLGGAERFGVYLESLEMELEIARVTVRSKERVFELLNKTNQFNLTGVRYDQSQLDEFLEDGDCWTVSLKDRLADHGVVGAVLVRQSELVQFVLSCRVFSRGIEDAVLAHFKGTVKSVQLAKTARNHAVYRYFTERFTDFDTSQVTATPKSYLLEPARGTTEMFRGKTTVSA